MQIDHSDHSDHRHHYIRVEYDPSYYGGDYSGVGEFMLIPYDIVDDSNIGGIFEEFTGHSCNSIIHYTFDDLYDVEGNQVNEE